MDLSPQDRDMMIRTVIGEAGNQGDDGQAAVAHVILNRTQDPSWGGTPASVVTAPGQFEPWQTRRTQLLAINPASPQYQAVGKIVDGTASGDIPDPTNGATYFLQPDIVKARRGGSLPTWASGASTKIGDHVFYYNGSGNSRIAAASQPGNSGTDDVTPADVAQTTKMLGLNIGGPVAPGGVSPDDVADTAQAAGIKLKPQRAISPADVSAVPDTVMPHDGEPLKITIRPKVPYGVGLQNQLVQGMPVISPLFDRAVAASGAGISPVINAIRRLTGQPPNQDPATFGQRYDQNLSDIRQDNQQFAQQNPVASTAAQLAGGATAFGPLAASNAGRIFMGAEGPSMASRMLTGGLGMGTLGGTDAALRGDNPVTGAEIGAGGGAFAPLIGAATRGATNFVANNVLPRVGALRDLGSGAVAKLLAAFEGETPTSMAANTQRMGPAGFVGDINPAFTDLAGGVADTPGPGKQVVREAYQTRAAQQRQRVEGALNQTMGPPANIEDFKNFTTEAQKTAASPLYKQWESMQVQPTDKLKALIPRLEAAKAFDLAEQTAAVRGEPLNKSFFTTGANKQFPTAKSWDLVKRGLDRGIDQAYRAGDKTHAADLIKLKNEMIGEIEKTDAGKVWNQARTEFADRAAILDQLDAGRDTFLGGRSAMSADQLREELSGLKGPELAARITGARDAVRQTMGATLNGDTTMRNKLLAPNNVEKLELMLGKKEANRLIETLSQEKYLGEQTQNVIGGSQTAPKTARVNALAAPAMPSWGLNLTEPMTWLPPSMREQFTPHGVINAWRGQNAATAANQLAPILATRADAPEFSDLIRAMHAQASRQAAGRVTADRLGNAVSALIAGPGATTARRQYLPAQ